MENSTDLERSEFYIQSENREFIFGENPLILKFFSAFPAFSHRNYRLYFAGQIVSLSGTWLQIVAQGWLVLELTHSAFMVGLVSAISSVPVLLFSLFAGVIVDRIPRKTILIITQSASFVFALILGLLAIYGKIDVVSISILIFLLGCVTSLDMPSRQAFTVDIVKKEDLTSAIALNSGVYNAARVIGPSIAGFLIAIIGSGGVFIVNALSFLAVVIALLFMGVKSVIPKVHPDPILAIEEGLSYSFAHSGIRLLLVFTAATSIFGWSFVTIMPVVVEQVFHMGATTLGYFYAISGAGAVLGTILVSAFSKKINRRLVIFGGCAIFSVFIILFTLTKSVFFATPFLFLSGLGIISQISIINSTIQHTVSDEIRGRVMSIYSLMFVGLMPLGSLEIGFVAEHLGASLALRISGFIMFLFGLFFFSKRKNIIAH